LAEIAKKLARFDIVSGAFCEYIFDQNQETKESGTMAREKLRIDEKTKSKVLSGKTYIVTGANSGVGLETTRQLIKQGGHVVMACRRVDAAKEAAADFGGLRGSYEIMRLDLADLQSIRGFAKEFQAKHKELHGLDCNAGMVNTNNDITRTKNGLELTMQVSFFGHFLLTELLLDVLKRSAPSRVVILSSVVHAGDKQDRPDVHLEDLNFDSRKYNNFAAYGEAKLANVLYARELARRLKGTGVTAYSVHPGWARSNFGSGASGSMKVMMALMRLFTRTMTDSNEESAQTSLHCLLSDEALEHNGAYFSQSSVLYRDRECKAGGWPLESPNPNARNDMKAAKLVEAGRKIVGLNG